MKRRSSDQAGAALLMAMLIVALVATLAAAMVWQQWRSIQVESAERARTQSAWILHGALDWSRLILREDARADNANAAGRPPHDHLGEPWATPLAEARLSTFLAADRDNNTDSGPEAFLSGQIVDAQARYNLRNLVADDGKLKPAELAVLTRLCEAASLPGDTASRIAQALAAAWAPRVVGEADPANRRLAPQRLAQLSWVGVDAATLEILRPLVELLPLATPINLNTAAREVIAAVLDLDLATAERLVQARQRSAFQTLDAVKPLLPPTLTLEPARVGVGSSYFHVSGRLRLDERVLEETSLVRRNGADVVSLNRERRSWHAGSIK